jgi:signal transduction histidine kinase
MTITKSRGFASKPGLAGPLSRFPGFASAIANAATRKELQTSRYSLGALTAQQDALRRLATLVARGAEPEECFAAVATEMALCLEVEKAEVFRYEDDGGAIGVACHVSPGISHIPIGERITPEDHKVAKALLRSGFAAVTDGNEDTAGAVGARLRELGLGSVAGAPIVVDGRLWGLAVVGSTRTKRLPRDTRKRIAEFADLVATAIAASTTRADLIASRARIVAASDEARRRLERDLHDGAQQRLVSLLLKIRAAATDVPDELDGLKEFLGEVVSDLTDVTTELQQISRGIHPPVLSKGGLAPALRVLANRSAIPARVEVAIEGPVPGPVAVGAYYIFAEALTNAAKHSHATEVMVSAQIADAYLYLSVTDNGIGGANPGKGSGLVGLNDRVEALGGSMTMTSTPGSGTSLNVIIPVRPTEEAAWSPRTEAQAMLPSSSPIISAPWPP